MTHVPDTQASDSKKIKVNWAQECVTGALISAVFTILAANAGTGGVISASIAARLHNFIIIGGVAMGAICGVAAVVLIVFQIAHDVVTHLARRRSRMPKAAGFFGQLQAARFVKIFLP